MFRRTHTLIVDTGEVGGADIIVGRSFLVEMLTRQSAVCQPGTMKSSKNSFDQRQTYLLSYDIMRPGITHCYYSSEHERQN